MEVHILASGSDGNCAVVRHDDTAIMIDAGLSRKRTLDLMARNGIDDAEIAGMFITHEHADHIGGAGPVARKFDCPVYCNDPTFGACGDKLGKVTHVTTNMFKPVTVGTITVTPLPTSHDAKYPCCYKFEADGKKGIIATDTGYFNAEIKQALREADIAVMESNYDARMLAEGPYSEWLKRRIDGDFGHVSNIMCARTIKEIFNPNKKFFLAHLSKTNNIPDIAKETAATVTGIRKQYFDCLDVYSEPNDTRILRC